MIPSFIESMIVITRMAKIPISGLKGNFKMERQLLLNIAQIYISEAYNYGDINVYSLNNGIRAMKKVNKIIPINLSWDCARCKVAEMRLMI